MPIEQMKWSEGTACVGTGKGTQQGLPLRKRILVARMCIVDRDQEDALHGRSKRMWR